MKRSKHSLTNYKLLTCKMGQLIPVDWFEALPGDTIQMSTSCLVRAAPMVTPAMHPCHIRVHHFFVPNRLIWANWQNFITGGPDGLDATSHPQRDYAGTHTNVGSVGDYLGVPTAGSMVGPISVLPHRAYGLIYNEYFRDQDLQSAVTVSTADGADTTTYGTATSDPPLTCSWEKDYLTSARPWEVKGASVTIPLGTTAPILGLGFAGTMPADRGPITVRETTPEPNRSYSHAHSPADGGGAGGTGLFVEMDSASSGTTKPKIFADLANASSVTINTLRHALAVQRFEEARARYGSRYTEYLRYLGVRSSDQRLQRPEYLGGGRSTLQISEVLNTTATNSATMYGHGISAMRSNRFRRFFEEHGIVMTLMSVRPRTMYSQALHRPFMRGISTYTTMQGGKEDYWQRELQHIGQQKVNNAEVDVSGSNGIFGYQDRYDEYRRRESQVAGLFRSSLDTWHLSREFGGAPSLNSSFVSCVPSTRIFADTANDNLYVMAHNSVQARRLVSREGNSLTF